MTRDQANRWLGRYIEAWRTYDRERIAALFSVDAKYRYHPYDEWICGRDAIVSSGALLYRLAPTRLALADVFSPRPDGAEPAGGEAA